MINIFSTIVAPIITEKATLISGDSKFTCKVAKNATKQDIKHAIEKLFSVQVVAVNVMNYKPRLKIFKGRKGYRSGYKKAIITLKQGDTIELGKGV